MTDHPEQHLDMVREDFEAWATGSVRGGKFWAAGQPKKERDRYAWASWQAAAKRSAERIAYVEKIAEDAIELCTQQAIRVMELEAEAEGHHEAFGAIVDQKRWLADQKARFEETIRSQQAVIVSMRQERDIALAQVKALRRDNDRLTEKAEVHDAINRACDELPEGYDLHIELEKNAGTVRLYLDGDDASIEDFGSDLTFVGTINAAIDAAVGAMKEKP